jgi:hypothetical protein
MISLSRFSLEVDALATTSNIHRAFRDVPTNHPLPPLVPYVRCTCGACRDCRDNAKWDRIFARHATKEREEPGFYGCALNDL